MNIIVCHTFFMRDMPHPCIHVIRFIILYVIRFIWLHLNAQTDRIFCIIQDMCVYHLRLQRNKHFSEKQWFSNQVAVRGTEVSPVALKSIHFQHFIAVILHPKSNAMYSASMSFRQEQGLMLRRGQDSPELLPFGMWAVPYEG